MIGIREPEVYGTGSYDELCKEIIRYSKLLEMDVSIFQSNHEGEIIDEIQAAHGIYDGIIINAGGYTHTSIAILDALKAVNIRTVEVHLTDIATREEFRRKSFISYFAEKMICGKGFDGYYEALEYFNG